MIAIRHTLVSDGVSDANLIPIIDWSLREAGGVQVSQGTRAEFWRLPSKPLNLVERVIRAMDLFPCDVLFVHRDAEREAPGARVREIQQAVEAARERGVKLPAVAVIPVRMLEAWLLFDERAIRQAAGNPNGVADLNLPPQQRVESRSDPKKDLAEALLAASELSGRRRKKFDSAGAFWRIVECIEDFSPLRQLSAFQSFENSIRSLKANNWKPGLYA